jgi:glutamine amidotransferase
MQYLLNLAGFGIVAWDHTSHHSASPFRYRTPQLPFYDENLRNISTKITPYCLLAHLRGVSYNEKQIVSQQNVHPFLFSNTNVALAHNGTMIDFEKMKFDLLDHIKPEYQKEIRGTTDSEWIYAVFLSQLTSQEDRIETSEIIKAILNTLRIIAQVRQKHKIDQSSPANLFITNGEYIAATRFVFDYGWQPKTSDEPTHFSYHSLWYTFGEQYGFYDNIYRMKGSQQKSSIIIASEPLTEDTTTWIELPEYTLLVARRVGNEIKIVSQDISL